MLQVINLPSLCFDFDCRGSTSKETIGALSIFLAWMALVLFIRKFPKLGIYVVMFTSIMYTFTKFFIIFVLFLVAFALAFHTLLHTTQVRYSSLHYTLNSMPCLLQG